MAGSPSGGEDVITFMAFPDVHWRRMGSTNGPEPFHRQINRRCSVVGIFPNARSGLRRMGAVAVLWGKAPQELEVLLSPLDGT